MTTTPESIARNLIRFFILIVLEAGIFSGIAATLLIGDLVRALVIVLAIITAVACGWIVWKQKTNYIGNEVIESAARSIAKIFLMIVFVAGIILGIAVELLTGLNVVTLVAVLFGALLVMGVWLFKEMLLGKWWK
ncbi:MAG: hypothetical protein WCX79_00425 [Candidatus Paceibacterota bacterium]|jgi:hypothetical protein